MYAIYLYYTYVRLHVVLCVLIWPEFGPSQDEPIQCVQTRLTSKMEADEREEWFCGWKPWQKLSVYKIVCISICIYIYYTIHNHIQNEIELRLCVCNCLWGHRLALFSFGTLYLFFAMTVANARVRATATTPNGPKTLLYIIYIGARTLGIGHDKGR